MNPKYRFDCPECRCDCRVDATVRGDLLAEGCIFCGTDVSSADFSPLRYGSPTN